MLTGNEYLEAQVTTANPQQLHLLVVDGAIKHAKQGLAALQEHDFEAAHFALNSSRDFVAELISGLDPSRSEELVAQVRLLFLFAQKNLIHADLEHNPKLVQDAVTVLEQHRQTWIELIAKLDAEQRSRHQKQVPPTPHGNTWTS